MQELTDKIYNEFITLMSGVRVQMLINRGISSANKGSKRWVSKLISTCKEEAKENIYKLLMQMNALKDNDVRLYMSMNERNIDSAIRYFKHQQIDLSESKSFYKDIHNRFVSALMKPENRYRSAYLLDVDSKITYSLDDAIVDNDIIIQKKYPTPSGWHYVVDDFDVRCIDHIEYVEVKKDGLLLLCVMDDICKN